MAHLTALANAREGGLGGEGEWADGGGGGLQTGISMLQLRHQSPGQECETDPSTLLE